MRRIADFVSYGCAAILGLLLLQGAATSLQKELTSTKQSLSFAQITDPHIFDDGWKNDPPGPLWDLVDDHRALRWAIDEINKRADRIDFVVLTGDFGLENVLFEGKKCNPNEPEKLKGLPQFRSEGASATAANEFAQLQVRDLYLVVGNNDLVKERPDDYTRFECFVQQMQNDLKAIGSSLNLRVLTPDKPVSIRGFRLAGLNSASFKKEENYSTPCAEPQFSNSQACPGPQIRMLEKSLKAETTPLLLFTHIPDLKDPKPPNPPSWQLSGMHSDWLKVASQPQLGAIFAGHFHSNRRELYATNSGTKDLFVDPTDGEKTWVAPPLAGKYQRAGGEQARGLMWVTVESIDGKLNIKADPGWYEAENPAQGMGSTRNGDAGPDSVEKKGAAPMSQLGFSVVVFVVMVVTGLFGGLLNFLLNKKPEKKPEYDKSDSGESTGLTGTIPTEPAGAANFVLGVGAAFLIPLFLHAIGSDLVREMHYGDRGNPLYSDVFVFAGYCLVASMSSRVFIESVSGRVLKQTARDTKQAAEEAVQKLKSIQNNLSEMRNEVHSRLQALESSIKPPDSDSNKH